MSETRWAWRNIVARCWRAVLTIGLLALALAATTIVFSAADSPVFRRVAYPSADRLLGPGRALTFRSFSEGGPHARCEGDGWQAMSASACGLAAVDEPLR
jgi:hypothetical protein